MRRDILRWKLPAFAEEFVRAGAYSAGYYDRFVDSLKSYKAVIVYNAIMKQHIEAHARNVLIIPGGVDVDRYTCTPAPVRERKIVLMTGRVEDPMKGLATLREAGALLAKRRNDFEIWATHTDYTLDSGWFKAVGWRDHAGMTSLYAQADFCVAPSIWEEPFGLVAVEAMASGRAVIASRVGGLQNIVVDGETGYLFDRQNAEHLAGHMEVLLDDQELRARMGRAARLRAEMEYDWRRIVERHYPSLLELAIR